MTTRTVIYVPDERLRRKAATITQFTPDLNQLSIDMLETMRSCEGVGLAGPQIGVMDRIFVAEIPLPKEQVEPPPPHSGETYVLINPEILKFSTDLVEGQEGCLSIPGWAGLVERPEWVEVKALDVTGQPLKIKAVGLLARIFMHEMDHLNGVLYTDHITDPEKLWPVSADEAEEPAEVV
ncbi:MAG: peptide deformylase [Anaerolineae bacterium]|nr:peptide deformylase [Anaerolineae bacterium]